MIMMTVMVLMVVISGRNVLADYCQLTFQLLKAIGCF